MEHLTRQVIEVASQWSMARWSKLTRRFWWGSAHGGDVCLRNGDVRGFANPRQLMAYGLVPSESSTGTECGVAASPRQVTDERGASFRGPWTYRFPATVGVDLQARQEGLPEGVRAIAWKAQFACVAAIAR